MLLRIEPHPDRKTELIFSMFTNTQEERNQILLTIAELHKSYPDLTFSIMVLPALQVMYA